MKMIKLQWCLVLVTGLWTSCYDGPGSDVGSAVSGRPAVFLRGLVVDDAGKPIVSARVTVVGGDCQALTRKSGRFLLPNPNPGASVLQVDGRYASADGSDSFGRLRVPWLILQGGGEISQRLVLPDLNNGDSATVTPGVQGSQIALDTGVVELEVDNGATVGVVGESDSFSLSLARFGVADNPSNCSLYGGLACTTRAVMVDPPMVVFSSTATLKLPDELGLNIGEKADLWRLHPETGQWDNLGQGTVDANDDIVADLVPGGGVYIFAVERNSSQGTLAIGTVKDKAGAAVVGAIVQGPDGVAGLTDENGLFSIGPVAATDASNAARNVTLIVRAGGGWAPARQTAAVALSTTGNTAVGDLELDTVATATLQMIGVYRGYPDKWQYCTGGGVDFSRTGRFVADSGIDWEDTALGQIQSRAGYIREDGKWCQGTLSLDLTRRDHVYSGSLIFGLDDIRNDGVDGVIRLTTVAEGGGLLPETEIFLEGDPNGSVTTTDILGKCEISGRNGAQLVTAYREQDLGGNDFKAIVTMQGVDVSHLTLPLPHRSRSAGATYGEFGEYSVNLLSIAGGGTTGITGRVRLTEWDVKEALLVGDDLDGLAPTRGTLVGVPANRGSLCAWEVNGSNQLVGLALENELSVSAGTRSSINLDLADHPAASTLILDEVLAHRSNKIGTANFSCGLSFKLANGEALFMRRNLAPQVNGNDLQLAIPALTGGLAGGSYIVSVVGSATSGGKTYVQKALTGGTGLSQAPVFLAVPEITSPAAGATVSSTGLKLTWNVPPNMTAQKLVASWTDGTTSGEWAVWLAPNVDEFTFFSLPSSGFVFFPGSGKTVQMKITAFRHEASFIAEQYPYDRFIGAVAWANPHRLGVTACSSVTMNLTMQ